jgi:hypothetical protein
VGDTITVLRNISPVQDTSFVSTGPKTPLLTEQDDDNLTALIQQVLADLKPAMRAPPDEDVDWTLPGASLRTTSFPYFDGTGSLTLLSLVNLSTLLSGGTSVSGTTSANYFFAGPTSGSANTPAFRAMVTADLGTTLTPQVAQLGINVAPYSTFPLISYHATNPQWLGYDGTIGPLYSGGIRGYSVTNQGGYVALGTLQNNVWTPVLVINHQNAATFASTIATAGGVPFDITAVNSVSPTSPNRTVSIILNGTTYYLAAKTTNN